MNKNAKLPPWYPRNKIRHLVEKNRNNIPNDGIEHFLAERISFLPVGPCSDASGIWEAELIKMSHDPNQMDAFDENIVTHELLLEPERYRSKQKLERSCLLNWLKKLKSRDDYELENIYYDIQRIKSRKCRLGKSKARNPEQYFAYIHQVYKYGGDSCTQKHLKNPVSTLTEQTKPVIKTPAKHEICECTAIKEGSEQMLTTFL